MILRAGNSGFPEEAMFPNRLNETTLNGDIESLTYNKLSRRFQIQPQDGTLNASNVMNYEQAVNYCNN